MQSTSAAIAVAAMSGADLGAKANDSKGPNAAGKNNSTSGALSSNGFDPNEAKSWMQKRWKDIQSSSADKRLSEAQRPETYKPAPGTVGSAWGSNKKTINERFTSDLLKASTVTGSVSR